MQTPASAPLTFDQADSLARSTVRKLVARGQRVTLVRDVLGRFSLFLADEAWTTGEGEAVAIADDLMRRLGPYAAPSPVHARSALSSLPDWEADPETEWLDAERVAGALIERTVTGGDWRSPSDKGETDPVRRVAMYGFKGGVGRSTATFLLAEHLATQGRCVLVVDLDLESPGVGTLLAAESELPAHGVVDHMVESAVGSQAPVDMVAQSRKVRAEGNGEVWLAPAGGAPRDGYSYLPKLNRIYTDVPGEQFGVRLSFARRLEAAVEAADAQVTERSRRPDVVLFDSRAGVHDIAAVAITRLADLSLLFAADSPQTWRGYSELFAGWARRPDHARAIRQRLKLVAVQLPTAEDRRDALLTLYRDHAQQLFADTLYDDIDDPAGDGEGYNPSRDDLEAPHSPLPIPHVTELVGLDPSRDSWQRNPVVDSAFAAFNGGVADLLGPVASS